MAHDPSKLGAMAPIRMENKAIERSSEACVNGVAPQILLHTRPCNLTLHGINSRALRDNGMSLTRRLYPRYAVDKTEVSHPLFVVTRA